ncbi:membrane protein insertase YidC [Thalassiella azotivora]
MDFFAFLTPIEIAVAWLMVQFHSLLTMLGMPEASGWTWGLSIVGLVIVMRILLIPLFVKQIKASRGLQLIQPEMRKIQAKYKGKTDPASRQAMTQETMELYKRTGTNPFASCLPILLQAPIFFGLFRVLNGLRPIAEGRDEPIGALTQELAAQAEQSTLFGAQLSSTFLGSEDLATKLVTVVLIILMSATTFTTQKQLMTKNMPAAALDNPFAQQQKILLYALPVIFAVSGVNFPIGVLIYWFTTNVWSMGQQFYVIRRMPAPGSAAEKALMERRARKGKPAPGADAAVAEEAAPTTARGQRVQPKRKDRQRGRRPGEGPTAATGGADEDPGADPEADGRDDGAAPASDVAPSVEGDTTGPRGGQGSKGTGAAGNGGKSPKRKGKGKSRAQGGSRAGTGARNRPRP